MMSASVGVRRRPKFLEINGRPLKLYGVINHDELFKSLLKTGRLLEDFFAVFFPRLHRFIDFGHIEFLDKERFTHRGERRTGDLLIKTRFRGKPAAFLIHLEHEAHAHRDLARRMLEYFILDWRQYNMPVYPIAVLSHRKLDTRSLEPLRMVIRGHKILDFRFAVIDLARLEAGKYVRKLNAAALALSARMRMDAGARIPLALDFIRNTAQAQLRETEQDAVSRFYFAYQQFRGEEGLQLVEKLSRIKNMEIPKDILRNNPLVRFGRTEGRQEGWRQGRQEGWHKGRQEGQREGLKSGQASLVLRLLARRLGPLPVRQEQAIRKLTLRQIGTLAEALLDFQTRSDLTRWLKSIR